MAGDKPAGSDTRTVDDLDRAVRALGRHFDTDEVIVIGSQAILVHHAQAPVIMRTSGEIDAYPGNSRVWESQNPGQLASEEINALFGSGSRFHERFGFYIDGVDANTAKLPPDWKDRADMRAVDDNGGTIRVIAPSIEDLIVSKLFRLDEKDRDFIRAWHALQPLDGALIRRRLAETEPEKEVAAHAEMFLEMLL